MNKSKQNDALIKPQLKSNILFFWISNILGSFGVGVLIYNVIPVNKVPAFLISLAFGLFAIIFGVIKGWKPLLSRHFLNDFRKFDYSLESASFGGGLFISNWLPVTESLAIILALLFLSVKAYFWKKKGVEQYYTK